MKNLFKKIAIIATLSFATSTIQADDTFSHAVLLLPGEPRIEEAWTLVINTQKDWDYFYQQSNLYLLLPVPTPILDFENYQVLAGGLGVQSSGGMILVVKDVQELEKSIAVHVLVVRPSSNCSVPMIVSYPSTTILVKKTVKPFSFTITQLSDKCAE